MAWSQTEIEQLKECYYTSTSKELEEKFGRAIKAIRTKAERMGMRIRNKKGCGHVALRVKKKPEEIVKSNPKRPPAIYSNINYRSMLLDKYAPVHQ